MPDGGTHTGGWIERENAPRVRASAPRETRRASRVTQMGERMRRVRQRLPLRRVFRAVGRGAARVGTVMFGVVVAVFFLLRMVPGDPAAMILGERATPDAILALRTELGLDLPLWRQFTDFLVLVVTQFDTGDSLATGVPTRELVFDRAPISLGIVALAVVFALLIAVPLALAAALNRDGVVDHAIRILPAIGMGLPLFWVGLILILIFAVQLRWFPVGGVGDGPGEPFVSLVLPALAVAIGMAPPLIRSLRAQLIDTLSADFVTTLRAARIPESRILFRHVLRGAALPTLALLGVNTAYLIGGTLVVEKVFGINGLGTLLFQSIGNRDFPVVQGVALYCAVLVVIVTAIAGGLAALLDPRLRSGDADSAFSGGDPGFGTGSGSSSGAESSSGTESSSETGSGSGSSSGPSSGIGSGPSSAPSSEPVAGPRAGADTAASVDSGSGADGGAGGVR